MQHFVRLFQYSIGRPISASRHLFTILTHEPIKSALIDSVIYFILITCRRWNVIILELDERLEYISDRPDNLRATLSRQLSSPFPHIYHSISLRKCGISLYFTAQPFSSVFNSVASWSSVFVDIFFINFFFGLPRFHSQAYLREGILYIVK